MLERFEFSEQCGIAVLKIRKAMATTYIEFHKFLRGISLAYTVFTQLTGAKWENP